MYRSLLMELKMVFYLSNVANAVNLSQPSVCIGGGLHVHQFIHLSQALGLGRSIFQRLDNGSPTCCKVRSRVRRAARRAQDKLPFCHEWGCQAVAIGECARGVVFIVKKTTHLVGVILCRTRAVHGPVSWTGCANARPSPPTGPVFIVYQNRGVLQEK